MSHPLRAVAVHIAAGRTEQARRELHALLAGANRQTTPQALQVQVFGRAMAHTLSDEVVAEANLYLRDYDVPQIHLFDLLASSVPLVGLARKVGNHMLEGLCRGHEEVVLVDIGIGSGLQEAALLRSLGGHSDAPRRVTVVGIEVQGESLAVAAQHLTEAGRDAGIEVRLVGHAAAVEDLGEADWTAIAALPGPKVALSSFALHHVGRSGGEELRDGVLRRLAALPVEGFVLTEPDSDHLVDDYVERFDQAWHHFGATFGVLDRLDLDPVDRGALKASFFGRELVDILGTVDGERSERHESARSWWQRLAAAGFQRDGDAVVPPSVQAPVIQAVGRGDHVSIGHDGVGIVAVIEARPPG